MTETDVLQDLAGRLRSAGVRAGDQGNDGSVCADA